MAAIVVGDKVRPKLTSVLAAFGFSFSANPQPSRYGIVVTEAAGAISVLGETGTRIPETGTLLAVSFDRIVAPDAVVRDFWLNTIVQPFSVTTAFTFEYAMKVVDVIAVDVGAGQTVTKLHRLVCRALKGGGWYELSVASTPPGTTDPTILTYR